MPNLFVMGATAFPQNAGYNPTGTVGALAYLGGRCDRQAVSEESRPAGAAMSGARLMRRGALLGCLLVIAGCSGDAAATAPSRSARATARISTSHRARPLPRDRSATAPPAIPRPAASLTPAARAIETPFGSLVAPNITPDRETGIGAWSDDDFVSAVQNGSGRGGVRLYPAMPYPYYTKMTRDDVLAIRAYLDTLEPVHNQVAANQLPFPFNIRASMIVLERAVLHAGPSSSPIAGKSAEWNRGAYLVEGAGHCGACHTPKNVLGGDKTSHALQGGVLQGWYCAEPDRRQRAGLGGWSADEIVAYLKIGPQR